MKRYVSPLMLGICVITCLFALSGHALERGEVPERETWDLSILFPDQAAWEASKQALQNRFSEMDKYQGRLADSAGILLDCLNLNYEIRKEFSVIRTFATQSSDLDVRESKPMAMRQSLNPMVSELNARTAWLDPEILSIPAEKIEAFYKEEPGLEIYRPVIENIQRLKAHTLSPAEEKILADSGLMRGSMSSVYGIFANADIPRATVTLSTGEEIRLDAQAYTFYRGVPNRWDRELVFQAFFGNLMEFESTYGALLNGEVSKNLFYARARNYDSCLASALSGPNIPVAVYKNLIRNVNKNLPTLWRYLNLRKRIMGLGTLRYSDLYASIIKEVDMKYTVDQAADLVLKGVAKLGEDYASVLGNGFRNRWVDWHPTMGKRSGAYSNGSVYDHHPFILMNFTGTYEEVSTLAHEAGHAMHSYFSNKHQPYATAGYTSFVAEVASTCNEHLLMEYMLKNSGDDSVKLFLLGSYLDNIRLTLFRQTQFAEFELAIHELAESGVALTGEKLSEVYAGIIDKYYGVAEGVTEINPVCYIEWAYIPHFYYNFYVYTYATSITASTAISQMILEGRDGAVENYRKFLGLGGSRPPVDELKVAGVDMTTDEPFTITMAAMNKAMDEIEALLAKMGK
jgi:oligoendopeptidase F